MRAKRASFGTLKIGIALLWGFLAIMTYEQKQALGQKQLTNPWEAQAMIESRRATAPLPPIPGGDPGLWPPPPTEKIELAHDMTAANYVLVFDASFSMNQSQCSGSISKLQAAKIAVTNFITKLEEKSNVGLIGFGAAPGAEREYQWGFVSGGARASLIQKLKTIRAKGNTPLLRAMNMGYHMLQAQAQRQGGYGQYHMVIITDGAATDGDPSRLAKDIALHSPVRIHAVGFCLGGGHSLDMPAFTKYSAASDPRALEAGLMGALAESPRYDSAAFEKKQ